MRTFVSVQALVAKDSDQRQKLLEQLVSFDDDDPALSAEYQSSLVTLAALASDVVFNFGGVTSASMMLIIAYSNITVKLNGIGQTAIEVNITPAKVSGNVLSTLQRFDQPGVVVWRGKVTSIHLANPSAVDPADVFVAIVGNAA